MRNFKLFIAIVSNSYDWSKSFNTKKHPFKIKFKYIFFVNCFSVGSCTLCVKMKTFLCEESVLPHNKRKCFPSYLDHYLKSKNNGDVILLVL